MNRLKLIKEIEMIAGSDSFYKEVEKLGKLAANDNLNKTQLHNLINIANTTLKVTDVIDYIKKQSSRNKEWKRLSADFLNFINKIKTYYSPKVQKNLQVNEETDIRLINLLIVREAMKGILVNFLYKKENH